MILLFCIKKTLVFVEIIVFIDFYIILGVAISTDLSEYKYAKMKTYQSSKRSNLNSLKKE